MAIVTISRGTMSGGEALASCLSSTLGCPLVGREVLVAAADRLGVSEEGLARAMAQRPGLLERMTLSWRLYVLAVQTTLVEHAISGRLVYHGNAGHLLLRGVPGVLRVRLIAPLDMRVRAVMDRQKLSRDDASGYIRRVDEERTRWTKFMYGVDWSDPALYDLVVNLEQATTQTACAAVACAAERPEFTSTAETIKKLADLLLECRVKLALATNPTTRGLELEVRGHDGSIDIAGDLPRAGMLASGNDRDETEVRRTAEGVDGVKTVFLDLRR